MAAFLESSIVRIYSNSGKVVGAGFLVSPKHVLTCAHVVNDALGISRTTQEQPDLVINLDFPLLAAKQLFAAKVIFWRPVNRNEVFEDIAGLELETSLLDTAQPAQFLISENLWGHRFRVFGFPAGQPNGVSASGVLRSRTANGWVQVEDVKQTGYRVEPGFSGAPVWDDELHGVVGMAVAAEMSRVDVKVAFIIPTSILVNAWPGLGQQAIPSSPYRGLFAFREQDAKFFFGREELIKELVAAVQKRQLLAVIGPSGSGKSSVVFAGLIHELRSQQGWLIGDFRPGDRPFRNLASSLVPWLETNMSETDQQIEINKLDKAFRQKNLVLRDVIARILEKNSSNRLLLVADQFEELYTLCQNDSERQEFLKQLLETVKPTTNLTLILTLRADFLGHALSHRPLADALQNADLKLGSMNRKELQDAIEKPAGLLGVKIQPGLTKRILNAVEEKPGYLPLLEFTLDQLWKKQKNGELTHQGYEEIGEVEMALADYAEKKYLALKEVEEQRWQRVFIQLVFLGKGTEDTRRVATRAEVGEDNWDLVTQLANARLVVTGSRTLENNYTSNPLAIPDSLKSEETVEIVHEALIQKWQRLRDWIKVNRTFLTWQERLRAAMYQWKVSDRDTGALLRGFPLSEAHNWLQKRQTYLPLDEREYIEISWEFYQKEEAKSKEKEFEIRIMAEANQTLEKANQEAKQRIKIGWVILSASLFLAAIAFIGTANAIKGLIEAQEGTKLEQAGVSALRQFRSGELDALLAAMQSGQRLEILIKDGRYPQDYPAASPVLALQKILDTIYEQNRLNSNQGEIKSANFSPTGQLIATAGKDGTVQLWNLSGQQQSRLEGHEGGVLGGVNSVSFSPNGQLIATAGEDRTVRLWDLSGKQLAQMNGHQSEVTSVNFSPNGHKFASSGRDGTVRVWDLSGREDAKIQAHEGGVNKVVFSPDGEKIATAGEDGVARVWTAAGNKLAELKPRTVKKMLGVSFSPDGQFLATASDDNCARIWTVTGQEVRRLEGHQGLVTVANFSPDSQTVATASDDGSVKLWSVKTGQQLQDFRGHRGVVWSASFSSDGQRLVSAGRDGIVRLWNLAEKPTQQIELKGFQDDVNAIAFSPDGKTVAGAGNEGIMRLWDLSGKELKIWKEAIYQKSNVQDIVFSPNNKFIVASGLVSIARVWDLTGSLTEPQAKLKGVEGSQDGHQGNIISVAVSPDNHLIATGSYDRTMRIWKPKNPNGELVAVIPEQEGVISRVVFTADGQRIFTADWDGNVAIWDLTGKNISKWRKVHQSQIRGLAITQDGSQIVTADKSSYVKIMNSSGKLHKEFFSYQSGINELLISPNGQLIATGGMDGTVRLWDFQGRQVAEFQNPKGAIWGIAFSPDSRQIALAGDRGFANVRAIESLPSLIKKGCKWLQDYLESHPTEKARLNVCR